MTGNDINESLGLLSDPDSVAWTPADRVTYINAGLRDIATHRPKATTVTEPVTLNAGSRQNVNRAAVIAVLDLTCNLDANGAPGRAITPVSAERLQASVPNWRRETGPAVRHFIIDDRDPTCFYVWPSPPAGSLVEGMLHMHPRPIDSLDDPLPLGDDYRNALVEYVLHMAYSRDAENAGYLQLSVAHFQKYQALLGIQTQQQKKASSPANSPSAPQHPVVDKHGA